eukprot:126248-Chlamydomonas_euryale.AAC.7
MHFQSLIVVVVVVEVSSSTSSTAGRHTFAQTCPRHGKRRQHLHSGPQCISFSTAAAVASAGSRIRAAARKLLHSSSNCRRRQQNQGCSARIDAAVLQQQQQNQGCLRLQFCKRKQQDHGQSAPAAAQQQLSQGQQACTNTHVTPRQPWDAHRPRVPDAMTSTCNQAPGLGQRCSHEAKDFISVHSWKNTEPNVCSSVYFAHFALFCREPSPTTSYHHASPVVGGWGRARATKPDFLFFSYPVSSMSKPIPKPTRTRTRTCTCLDLTKRGPRRGAMPPPAMHGNGLGASGPAVCSRAPASAPRRAATATVLLRAAAGDAARPLLPMPPTSLLLVAAVGAAGIEKRGCVAATAPARRAGPPGPRPRASSHGHGATCRPARPRGAAAASLHARTRPPLLSPPPLRATVMRPPLLAMSGWTMATRRQGFADVPDVGTGAPPSGCGEMVSEGEGDSFASLRPHRRRRPGSCPGAERVQGAGSRAACLRTP